jgi:SAM-dependent methyltransferase
MGRGRMLLAIGAVGAVGTAAIAVRRHVGDAGRSVPGGILMGDVPIYDAMGRLFLGSFYRGVAADVARVAPPQARILELGSGPGHLAARMAREHGLDVTGLDLDPDMVDRARANAARGAAPDQGQPTFVVGDAAALPFADGSFDLVTSTMSMHHWDDAVAGLREIARVLRPGGSALIWEMYAGAPLHSNIHDPLDAVRDGPMRLVGATRWRWPWRFSLTQRIELAN